MKLKLLSFALASAIAFASCKKDDTGDQVGNKNIDDITAPSNFNWSGSRDVSLSIGISDNSGGNQYHVIKVYSAEPSKGGELISSGSATQILPFNTKFALSSMTKEVYLEKISPSGAIIGQVLKLASDNMSATISASAITSSVSSVGRISANGAVSVVTETSPNCTTGCNLTPAPSNNSFDLNGTNVYCFTQPGTYKIQNINGSPTVRVCATGVTIENLKFNGGTTLIVATGGSVTLNNAGVNGNGNIKNFGTLTVNGNLQANTNTFSFYNDGTFSTSGELQFGSNSTAVNNGTITAGGKFQNAKQLTNTGTMNINGNTSTLSSGSVIDNSGVINFANGVDVSGVINNSKTITVATGTVQMNSDNPATTINNSGTFTATSSELIVKGNVNNTGTVRINQLRHNSDSKIVNNCKFFVLSSSFKNEINSPIENNSYFYVAAGMNINSGGKITLKNGALFVTNWIGDGFSEKITATGTRSVFKITGQINQLQNHNSSAKFSGALDVVYPSALPTAMFESGATQKSSTETVYIPTSDCMEGGSGTPTVDNDRDKDGIANDQDAYPDDATKAFNSYSENYINGGSTVAFEDSWPLKGDYDLNDVVINYKYKIVTNAQNIVVRVEADYKLLATGGEFQNGAGIEFPITAAKATNFSGPAGSSLESGQANAVVILFQNSRSEQATWNTQTGQTPSNPKDYAISFDIVGGPTLNTFGLNVFNPFIWNNSPGYGRGYETHLFGYRPTSKANTALFNTGNDATNQTTRFYGTANNLPWAITLPIATFKYPLERVPITDGYLQFSNWAVSGGSQSVDWYTNIGPAYRNPTKLYGSN